jgi:hypothetical protein
LPMKPRGDDPETPAYHIFYWRIYAKETDESADLSTFDLVNDKDAAKKVYDGVGYDPLKHNVGKKSIFEWSENMFDIYFMRPNRIESTHEEPRLVAIARFCSERGRYFAIFQGSEDDKNVYLGAWVHQTAMHFNHAYLPIINQFKQNMKRLQERHNVLATAINANTVEADAMSSTTTTQASTLQTSAIEAGTIQASVIHTDDIQANIIQENAVPSSSNQESCTRNEQLENQDSEDLMEMISDLVDPINSEQSTCYFLNHLVNGLIPDSSYYNEIMEKTSIGTILNYSRDEPFTRNKENMQRELNIVMYA